LGATGIKAAYKYVGEIEPRGRFNQHLMSSFYACRSQKRKKETDDLTVFFALLGYLCVKAAALKMLV